MTSILLPTDLSPQSLYPIHEICKKAGNDKCNIYIIHTLEMPTGIIDLLFLQEKKPYNELKPQFLEAIEMLRKKYSSVLNLLSFEFLWSNSRFFLRNYVEARNIGAIYLLEGHDYRPALPQSLDCISSLHKCRVPLVYVQKTSAGEYGTLTALLYRGKRNLIEADH